MKHPNLLLIGFTGNSDVGKDTCAKILYSKIPVTINTCILGFAAAIYKDLAEAFGLTVEELHRRKKDDPRIRKVLQLYGTEYGREQMGPDHWIDKFDKTVSTVTAPLAVRWVILVPDVRYLNEAEYIHEHDGLIFRVTNINAKQEQLTLLHSSEQEHHKIQVDLHINNSDSKLKLQVGEMKYIYDYIYNARPEFFSRDS